MATKTKPVLEIGCGYGNVTVGDDTVRVSVVCGRGNLNLSTADRTLCGKRLHVKLLARAAGGSDQESLPGAESDLEIESHADAMSFLVSRKKISFGLTFAKEGLELATLTQFAKRDGRMSVLSVGTLPKDDEGGGDDE